MSVNFPPGTGRLAALEKRISELERLLTPKLCIEMRHIHKEPCSGHRGWPCEKCGGQGFTLPALREKARKNG